MSDQAHIGRPVVGIPTDEKLASRDYPVVEHEGTAFATTASHIWSGPSGVNWGQASDYPAPFDYGSAYATAVGHSHPPFEAARSHPPLEGKDIAFGHPPFEGTAVASASSHAGEPGPLFGRPPFNPQIAERFGRPYADQPVGQGFAEADRADKPEFWRDLGHKIGGVFKHPWTASRDV